MVNTEHEYLPELVVSIDRVFTEIHLCSTRSFEIRIGAVDTVFQVGEIAFESIDVRFEVFNAHQSETKERVVPLGHQRKLTRRCWHVVRLSCAFANEFFAGTAQFSAEEFIIVHGLAHTGVQPATAPEGRSHGPSHRVCGFPTNARQFMSSHTESHVDILPALKGEDSHGTAPLSWDIVVYDVTCS